MSETCPICDGALRLLGSVDFNKSCLAALPVLRPELARQLAANIARFAVPTGVDVAYFACVDCGFCMAPALCRWSEEEFRRKIYNADYAQVDPEYQETRPRESAALLLKVFGEAGAHLRHLDYGGGNGLLTRLLREAGWDSAWFDPISRGALASNRTFDLVTAFEVFEHVPDPRKLIADLAALTAEGGMVLFSTQLSDGHIGLGRAFDWWYAAPRNGHISLYSSMSLSFLGAAQGFTFVSFGPGMHGFWRSKPAWAAHIRTGD